MKELLETRPSDVESALFVPKAQVLELRLRDGRELRANYPSDASVPRLEELLERQGIRHDSRGTGESAWWSILTYLLPFALFFGFWIFLMDRVKRPRRDRRSDESEPELEAGR